MSISERCLAWADVAGDLLIKYLGPALVCFGFGLIAVIAITALSFLVPVAADSDQVAYVIYVLVGLMILFNIVHNYLAAVLLSPGYVRDRLPSECEETSLEPSSPSDFCRRPASGIRIVQSHDVPMNEGLPGVGTYTYCGQCSAYRPERAHHCSACGMCVLKMDHHCPWINNCVGENNYKYFVKFLFHLVVGCLYSVFLSAKPFLAEGGKYNQRSIYLFGRFAVSLDIAISLSFVLCLSCTAAVGILLSFHLYLILSNQTTIEFYASLGRRRSNGRTVYKDYHTGDSHQNWEEVFGPTRWKIISFLPTFEDLGLRHYSTHGPRSARKERYLTV